MPGLTLIHFLIGIAVFLFFAEFARESYLEKKPRAVILNLIVLIILLMLWGLPPVIFGLDSNYIYLPSIISILTALIFFLPIGSRAEVEFGTADSRFDERNIMFSREEYTSGTDKYETYYSLHPELKKVDDRIRALPELLAPGGKFYDRLRSGQVGAIFRLIEDMTKQVDGPVSSGRKTLEADEATAFIKTMLMELGADEVGIARLEPNHVYSQVGRGPEKWGSPIVNNHKFVIVFSIEMAYEQVEKSPLLNITEETVRGYFNGALISTASASAIRNIGYSARAHIAGSNYQVILPAVGQAAGLGELGRFGYLISRKFGSRVRLGAITTDLPLFPDEPIRFGVYEFCRNCKKCADNCPSKAIPFGEPARVRGVLKWQLNMERCLTYWRLAGTDCGLCMRVCPFAHPPALVHRVIRKGIDRSKPARRISLFGDDMYYGRIIREFILNNPAAE